ncbi:hypothetical protein DZ956_022445 [Pseudomonas aeruginosa]|uniref:hypothetical protein n=1 Tax=Pseudomonas aeruginosa TaxID=287 RepID=UPI000E317326|nr:hypothetical protein [Pseudomonas aeruginosa]NPZ19538.1 hypothetical protein [Pseudomonas aeruginosa]
MPILNMMDNTGASIRRALAISQMLSLSASQLSQDELAEGLAELRAKLLEVEQSNEAAYSVAAQETKTPGQAPAQIHLVSTKPR